MKHLEPGSHLLTVLFYVQPTHKQLSSFLEQQGIRTFLDLKDPFFDPSSDRYAITFVATTSEPLVLLDTESIIWSEPKAISFDPFRELTYQLYPYELAHGVTYELRFLARMRAQPTRDDVIKVLEQMGSSGDKPGWDIRELSMLGRNIKLPGKPNADFTLWYAIAKWNGPLSPIIAEDPFTFEDVVAIANGDSLNTGVTEAPIPPNSTEHVLPANPL